MKIQFKQVWGMWNPGDIAESIDNNVATLLIERHIAEKYEEPAPKAAKPRKKRKSKKRSKK